MPGLAVVIATVRRIAGETGVQTYLRTFNRWLDTQGFDSRIVTPFEAARWKVYPIVGPCRIVEAVSEPWGVWWYRHRHGVTLRSPLRNVLKDGAECVV